MKKYLFLLFSFITSLLVISCQDEDFGYTEEEIFRNAYERNFEAKYGKIDPNQSWDLSSCAPKANAKKTRANDLPFDVDANNYYRVENGILNWIDSKLPENQDNRALGTAFGMLLAGQEFIAVPISQKGLNSKVEESYSNFSNRKGDRTNGYYYEITKTTTTITHNWDLYMVTLENGKTPVSTLLWSKNSSNNIQTPNSETITCTKCDGHGMLKGEGTVPCDGCAHEGYLPGDTDTCPHCEGNKTVKGPCTKCDANGHIECTKCKGKGYVPTDPLLFIIPRYTGCPDCLEAGSDDKKIIPSNIKKLGNRIQKCDQCDATKITDVECKPCSGTGKMHKCEICDGRGYGIVCDVCEGNRFLTLTGWEDIPAPYNTGDLGTHMFRSAYYEQRGFPEGSVVYFYLEVTPIHVVETVTERYQTNSKDKNGVPTGNKLSSTEPEISGPTPQSSVKKSSLSHEMIILDCSRPNNVNSDWDVMVIGCEEGDHTNKDYNDLVFMVIGRPLPEIFEYTSGQDVVTSYKKQYMVEDMGSAVDWDFNDIVIGVKHDIKRTLSESGGYVSGMTVTNNTKATVRYFCGTIPLRVKIGNTYIPGPNESGWIDDPTAVKATTLKLGIDWPERAEDPGNVKGWSPTEKEISVSGYDPDQNNITVWAKQGKDKNVNQGEWKVSFPKTGDTPYIIATDLTIPWMDEGDNIPDTWWKPKADNSTNK